MEIMEYLLQDFKKGKTTQTRRLIATLSREIPINYQFLVLPTSKIANQMSNHRVLLILSNNSVTQKKKVFLLLYSPSFILFNQYISHLNFLAFILQSSKPFQVKIFLFLHFLSLSFLYMKFTWEDIHFLSNKFILFI